MCAIHIVVCLNASGYFPLKQKPVVPKKQQIWIFQGAFNNSSAPPRDKA